MTKLEQEVRNMYGEIVQYGGSFGDPIGHGSYNPYEAIGDLNLTAFEHEGVSIAVLCFLDTAIDNSTYELALVSEGPKLRVLLERGLFDRAPLVREAAQAFLKSETRFLEALKNVYEQIVIPRVG